jgi:hypothetical protein
LIYDTNVDVQLHSLNILRNLACGKEHEIQEIYDGFKPARLSKILNEKVTSNNRDIIHQTIYIAVNIGTGAKQHKDLIISCRTFLEVLLKILVLK